MRALPAALALLLVGSVSCGPSGFVAPGATPSTRGAAHVPAPRTAAPSSTTAAPRPGLTIALAFHGSIAPVGAATRRSMGGSWHAGCPVPIADLRLLTLTFWGFDGGTHTGHLIVHGRYAAGVLGVFHTLYDARYPIRKMEVVHSYAGDHYHGTTDGPSDDDTAAFNCRTAVGSSAWSEHAYGRAVDLNPVENPYVGTAGNVVPREGRRFTDRSRTLTGMIAPNDVVVRAFASIGWSWGGAWHTLKDYMHFSATGR